jgi:hypothetical protein
VPIRDDETFALAREDVTAGLSSIFAPLEGADEVFGVREGLDEQEVITNASTAAVPWVYHCRHVGTFQGLVPTGRALRIDGVTVVDRSGDEPLFYRYIDWTGVIAQLGLMVSTRIPVTEEEYRAARVAPDT